MSLTNILISWSKSPQYISNGREKSKKRGGEEREAKERERREYKGRRWKEKKKTDGERWGINGEKGMREEESRGRREARRRREL